MRRQNRLIFEVTGDSGSPPVLFLHGFMGSSADWRGITTALKDSSLCIAVDLPGHGASLGMEPEAYTIDGAARAVICTLDELGIERPVIAGYSMGGRLALYLALRYPERCSGLFLESTSPGLERAEERSARREADEEKAKRLESRDFEEFLEDWYSQPLFAPLARDKNLLGRTIEARLLNEPGELARSLRGMGTGSQPSLWGELELLTVPALSVAGVLDEKYAGISSRMADLSPWIESVFVPETGHTVHAESPAEYISLLLRFLDGLTLGLGEAEPVP